MATQVGEFASFVEVVELEEIYALPFTIIFCIFLVGLPRTGLTALLYGMVLF